MLGECIVRARLATHRSRVRRIQVRGGGAALAAVSQPGRLVRADDLGGPMPLFGPPAHRLSNPSRRRGCVSTLALRSGSSTIRLRAICELTSEKPFLMPSTARAVAMPNSSGSDFIYPKGVCTNEACADQWCPGMPLPWPWPASLSCG